MAVSPQTGQSMVGRFTVRWSDCWLFLSSEFGEVACDPGPLWPLVSDLSASGFSAEGLDGG